MMSGTKEDIIRRVRALMEKTTSAGCSEAEAMAASEMVSRLMNKYQLDLTDIKLRETANCQEGSPHTPTFDKDPVLRCCNAIGYLTDTRVWISYGAHGIPKVIFFGMETDVIVAKYVYDIVARAIVFSWLNYRDEVGYTAMPASRRRSVKAGFEAGMVDRINARLREMKKAQQAENLASTGRDLVVVKSAIVDAEFDKLGLKLGKPRAGGGARSYDGGAFADGQRAGDRVRINPGVGADGTGRIG